MTDQPRRTRSGNETRQRTRLVQVRCTDGEHAQLVTAAERAGMTVGMFVRHQCLGTAGPRAARRPPIERVVLAQMVAHLGKVGSNVNQIARVLNSGGNAPEGIATTLDEVRVASKAVQSMLLGKRHG